MGSSPEYRAMVACTSDMVDVFTTDLGNISTECFGESFIPKVVHEEMISTKTTTTYRSRSQHLVVVLTNKVKTNPVKNFAILVNILKSLGDHYSTIIAKLEQRCKVKECKLT